MRVMAGPPWWTVFAAGAAWNAIVERSAWAAVFCLGVAVLCYVKRARKA